MGVVSVVVDPRLCQGHGRCQFVAPEAFGYDEESDQAKPADDLADVPIGILRAAALACPERAITVVEGPGEVSR